MKKGREKSSEERTTHERLAEKLLLLTSASETHCCWEYFGREDEPWSGKPSGHNR